MSKSKLGAVVAGIMGASLLAFCAGLLFTVMVIIPAREGRSLFPQPTVLPSVTAAPSVGVGPIAGNTATPAPTPTRSMIISTPTPRGTASISTPSATGTVEEQATVPSSPTPTESDFPFYYVEGSRVEDVQCSSYPYLRGWVRDADGAPLDGVTVEWRYWNNIEHAISGDDRLLWQPGEFKFTYYADDPSVETDFVLQVVESSDNPVPFSEPLVIRYVNCDATGQITNIVFRHY